MELTLLKKLKGNIRSKKRVGRGIGSGKGGHTVGKGNKGQKARSGNGKPHLGFEGGQVPLYKRLPQIKGFRGRPSPIAISLKLLNTIEDGEVVTPVYLWEKKLVKNLPKAGIKILANGELKKKLILKGFVFSASAKKKIESAGTTVL